VQTLFSNIPESGLKDYSKIFSS